MSITPNEPSPSTIAQLLAAVEAIAHQAAAPAARPSQPVSPDELSGVRVVVLNGRNPADVAYGAHVLSGYCGCAPGVLLADCDLWNGALGLDGDEEADQ